MNMNDCDLIVSFATYAPRLKHDNVKKMLQSILNQSTSLKYKIVMNIAKEDVQCISDDLNSFLHDNNVEINVVETNLYSHNKYFYVMQKYRDMPIITIDDDIKYSENLIEKLYQSYVRYPNSVHAVRCHLMTFNDNGSLKSYNRWKWEYKDACQPSKYLFATGCGGILYPPKFLPEDANTQFILDNFKTTDDFYLKYVSLLKNIDVCVVNNLKNTDLQIPNNVKLATTNVNNGKNNDYLKMINEFFVKEKTISLSDLEKYSFAISIDDERFKLFNTIFKYHGLNNIKKYEGFQISNIHGTKIQPHVNCQYSHLAIIKLAKTMNWPFVCIFEDDAYPCYEIKNKLEYYLTDIPSDCECLILGNVFIKASQRINNKYFTKINHIQGGHSYIIFNNAYDKIIELYNTTDMHCDIILSRLKSYSPLYNLFIQYDQKPSMNNYNGYVWKNRTYKQVLKEFPKIEDILSPDTQMRKKVIAMASFPPRKDGMISAIKQLLPQCDDFYLWLNEYESIPEELDQFDKNKLHITLSDVNLKENGRYTFIEQNKDAYFFICDDDIDWPVDYVDHTIKILNEYDCNGIVAYFINSDFLSEHKWSKVSTNTHAYIFDTDVVRFGLGTCAFVPEKIGYYPKKRELLDMYDIEILFGKYCRYNNIDIISPARPANYCKWKNINGKLLAHDSTSLTNTSSARIQKSIQYINRRFLKFIIPCYNCENSVTTMVDSILNQTCKDFFIVLVDDMSTDNTFNMIKDLEQKHPEYIKAVQVLRKAYADGAREYGFRQYDDAEFTWFVDADDKLANENAIQKLKDIHKQKRLDMYTFNSDKFEFELGIDKYGWFTAAPWFRIVRSDKVVFHVLNIPHSNDVIQSLMQYDSISDDRMFHISEILYSYAGMHYKKIQNVNTKCILKTTLSSMTFKKEIINKIASKFK